MSLKGITEETLKYLEDGQYLNESGSIVNFAEELKAAKAGTQLYRDLQLEKLLDEAAVGDYEGTKIEVTDERTQVAAKRLVVDENCGSLAILNFASARNPGGGFLRGAKAQEEDLSRCSGLYPCLLEQPDYYRINRAKGSMLYTDNMIYSPDVPWFRTRSRNLLDDYFLASVITAPAPNAGQCLLKKQRSKKQIETALRRRAGMVLALAKDQGCENLLLGAWGCGVFRNDPAIVADAFAYWLENQFSGVFKQVTFAIFDSTKEKNVLRAFQARLGGA